MEITLEEALQGYATTIKNKNYFSTKQYVEPFIDRMSKYTDNFIIKVKEAPQLAKEVQDFKIYNRVWVQAVLPEEYAYENHKQSMNLLYALDTRKPMVKLFKNTLNMACLNMCVFNPEFLSVSELEPEAAIDFRFINNVMSMTDNTKVMLERLANTYVSRKNIFDQLGKWVHNCIINKYTSNYGTIKLGESVPIEAYKNVFIKEDSEYYCEHEDVDYFTIYNAFTDLICNDKDKDIVNKFEKVNLVSNILEINN